MPTKRPCLKGKRDVRKIAERAGGKKFQKGDETPLSEKTGKDGGGLVGEESESTTTTGFEREREP